jgi:anaerobic selenocysteine-containing dehydrogenase
MSRLGHALTELGEGRDDGPPVKALFVYNSNPASVAPNQNAVLRGMAREDLFTVVHEQFFTDTTHYADLVLPATTFLETKDVQGAYGHFYVQVSNRAIAPLGEARNNTWLFRELAQRMGFAESCFADADDAMIDQALGGNSNGDGHAWFAGITRERLESEGHIPMALPRNAEGRLLPFCDSSWFGTPSGRGELAPVPVFVPPAESRGGTAAKDGRFPLEFLGRKADNYMNSTFANLPGHQKMEAAKAGRLEMHSADAAARGIVTGDMVEVFNGRGSVRLEAMVDGAVPPGVVAARLSWNRLATSDGEGDEKNGQMGNINALTSERLTDMGGGATFYSTLVEVRRAAPQD